MAKTTGTVYVKIKADTSALRASLDEFGETIEMLKAAELRRERLRAKLQQHRRMRRFEVEARRIRRLYAVADRLGRPVWECGPALAQLERVPQRWVLGL